jgi:hypothetical protein
MTMPHLMNCSHSEEGWCLECVSRLHNSEKTAWANSNSANSALMEVSERARLAEMALYDVQKERDALLKKNAQLLADVAMWKGNYESAELHVSSLMSRNER